MTAKDFRLMSAVVLVKLEQELGSYVIRKTPEISMPILELASEIEARENISRPNTVFRTTVDLVAATYIEDLFKLIQRLSESTPEYNLILSLKQLCTALSIFEIRNAIAHPNRPFLECYWYRIAAIANDPLIQLLELDGVQAAFLAAIEGKFDGIDVPPS